MMAGSSRSSEATEQRSACRFWGYADDVADPEVRGDYRDWNPVRDGGGETRLQPSGEG
jgi:hypothetical protein